MKRKKFVIRSAIGALLLYLFSYVAISKGGHYEPFAYGPKLSSEGDYVMVPKGALGYRWNPFGWTFEREPFEPPPENSVEHSLLPFYSPLIFLDHRIWHTRKEMSELEDGKYRVKNFYDRNGFRNIEP